MNEGAVLPLSVTDTLTRPDTFSDSQMAGVLTKLKNLAGNVEKKPPIPLDDEYSNHDKVPILEPNDERLKKDYQYRNIERSVQADMEYYSRTKRLEVDTPRVKFLQNNLDKMLAGTEHVGRVVIMNKGEIPDAHVYPEGTVFISQSLINRLDTVDELIAVLAHEAGHIINGTFFKKIGHRSEIDQLGVGWIHEAVGDNVNATDLLAKLGYNTSAFATAMLKIGNPGDRGTVHQSNLSRASQNVGVHHVMDYATSSKPQEILDEIVWKRTAEKTHAERLRNLAKTLDYEEMRDLLPRLHQRDFEQGFNTCHAAAIRPMEEKNVLRDELLDFAHRIVISRLQEAGHPLEDINLFFIGAQDESVMKFSRIQSYNMIQNPQAVVAMVDRLDDFVRESVYQNMRNHLFYSSQQLNKTYPGTFLEALADYTYYPEGRVNRRGIPLTEATMFDVLNKLMKKLPQNDTYLKPGGCNALFALSSYAESTFVKEDGTFDTTEVQEFIDRIKQSGMPNLEQPIVNIESRFIYTRTGPLFLEAFGVQPVEKERETIEHRIDRSLDEFNRYHESSRDENFGHLLEFLSSETNYINADNTQRLALARHFASKIDACQFEGKLPLRNYLEKPDSNLNDDPKVEDPEEIEFNRSLIRFRLKTLGAMAIFGTDPDEFYTFFGELLNDYEIDFSQFSLNQLVELNNPFFQDREAVRGLYGQYTASYIPHYRKDTFRIRDFERFRELPFMRQMAEKVTPIKPANLKMLNQALFDQRYVSKTWGSIIGDLYSDRFECLILGKPYQTAFSELLKKGILPDEYSSLYEYLKMCYPGHVQKGELLREINKVYLHRDDIALEQKIDHLSRYFDDLGPEGMLIVADQIRSPTEYKQFRDAMGKRMSEYLKGGSTVTKVAVADYLSSHLTNRFETLFDSAKNDPETQDSTSTTVAVNWAHEMFNGQRGVMYDQESGKAAVDNQGRILFRSFSDLVQELKGMSPLKRFALAQKSLTDSGGALTTPENRKKLGNIVNESLNISSPFVRSVLQLGCERVPPHFLSFPVARMLSPLLFRALDVEAVTVDKIQEVKLYGAIYPGVEKSNDFKKTNDYRYDYVNLADIIPEDRLVHLMTADTRSALLFGSQYRNQPEGFALQAARHSDDQYEEVTAWLRKQFIKEETNGTVTESTLDAGTEAVIRGIEGSSALGVRSLQLARQLHKFSEPVAKRLDQTFDANPGQNKLMFWENLHRVAEQDPEVKQFLEEKLISLEGYLGGGSLYTTYGAVIKGDNGEPRKVVLKMLNPNATLFIQNSYTASHDVLQAIAESDTTLAADRQYAKMGMLVVDMANAWCLKDINDSTFTADDEIFRKTITAFNEGKSDIVFYAPERAFNSFKLKSEDEAGGRTLNKILKDDAVPKEVKGKIISSLYDFMRRQLAVPTEQGNFVVHSDPHVGNYMVDLSGDVPRVGVIDRSMYLKLSQQDVDVLRPLLENQDYRHFAHALIQRMLDMNNVQGFGERTKVTTSILGKLVSEYAKQKLSGSSSNFELFRVLNAELNARGMEVSLETQLMVRNIAALSELRKQYTT